MPKPNVVTITKNIITVGKRFVAADQIAFVEAFDPDRNPQFKPESISRRESSCSIATWCSPK
jgi:hypothetical protein